MKAAVAGDAARHAHEEELQVVVVLEHAFGDEGLHEAGDVELLHADLRRDVHEAIRLEVPESNLGVRGEEGLEEVADLDASVARRFLSSATVQWALEATKLSTCASVANSG